jgi:hypothetical protein
MFCGHVSRHVRKTPMTVRTECRASTSIDANPFRFFLLQRSLHRVPSLTHVPNLVVFLRYLLCQTIPFTPQYFAFATIFRPTPLMSVRAAMKAAFPAMILVDYPRHRINDTAFAAIFDHVLYASESDQFVAHCSGSLHVLRNNATAYYRKNASHKLRTGFLVRRA